MRHFVIDVLRENLHQRSPLNVMIVLVLIFVVMFHHLAGTYSTSTSSSCLACPAGSFAPNTVSSSCSLCSVSTFSTSSSVFISFVF